MKTRWKGMAVCLVGLMLLSPLTGCSQQTTGNGEQKSPKSALAADFATYREVPVSVNPQNSPYSVEPDLSNVSNRQKFGFSQPAREALVKDAFVVIPEHYLEFFTIYETNRYDAIPNFITTDSLLHNYHLFFNHLLTAVETDHLFPELKKINQGMLAASLRQYQELKGTRWENAARRNVAFFAVGSALLDQGVTIPDEVKNETAAELALIAGHNHTAISPVMTMGKAPDALDALKEDYTQYIPRGHYDKTATLRSYFQAMMWYGRMTFRLKDEDETRSAALIALALEDGDNLASWQKIYDTTAFFVGKSDDLGYKEVAGILKQVYGNSVELDILVSDQAKWHKFLAEAAKLEGPAINSIPIYDATIQPDREREIKGFRFMGQRYTVDADIFQRLIYREVGESPEGERRVLPKGLDVPAALGSKEAQAILKEQGAYRYKNYRQNLAKLQKTVSGFDKSRWQQNLYWGWLYTLSPLLPEKPEGYPSFMRNQAWVRKELSTYLASWTELKHDSILYTKQVCAEMGGGGFDEDDRGYVEPNPELYARMAALTAMTREGLQTRGFIDDRDKENLERLEKLALALKTISEKELANKNLTDDEYELIRSYGGQLEHFWLEALRDQGVGSLSQLGDNPAALVADVATAPPDTVLEEGSGFIHSIYAVVPVAGGLRIAKGAVFSYYEFPWPALDRLTDRKWQQMLQEGTAPAQPEWTNSFIVNTDPPEIRR